MFAPDLFSSLFLRSRSLKGELTDWKAEAILLQDSDERSQQSSL